MKLFTVLTMVAITSAFVSINNSQDINVILKGIYDKRDSINRETYINQQLLKLKIKH